MNHEAVQSVLLDSVDSVDSVDPVDLIDRVEGEPTTQCGFIAIVGRPNVGKSSLMNTLLGKKVSITSFRPQTTRFQVLGIKTTEETQIVYIDTPGIHQGVKSALNRQMNKTARKALSDVDAVLFMVEALKWTPEDEMVCDVLHKREDCPVIVVINKIDLVPDKRQLLAFIQQVSCYLPHAILIPISVRKRLQLEDLESCVKKFAKPSPFYFPQEQSMNHSESFHAAEIVREKLMRLLAQEIPYATAVQVEKIEHTETIVHLQAVIYVEREGQKRVVIGEKGSKIGEIGKSAREDLERFYEKQVCLKLWVKVKERWSNDGGFLKEFGTFA